MVYSIDTSALFDAYIRLYAPDIFPKWWALFEESVRGGLVRTTQAVFQDIAKKDDAILAWMKDHPHIVILIDDRIQMEVKNILARYERLVDTRKNRSGADPFVIALARINNACVITGEKPTGKIDKPNIPDVCQAMNIRCINLLDFMRELKWRIE